MHLKLLRTAARLAVFGGIVTLGLGSAQAALAVSQTYVFVPCSTSALITDMTSPVNDTTLMLAPNCTYTLTAAYDATSLGLPAVMKAVTIVGTASTWIKRSTAMETPDFGIFGVGCTNGDLTLDSVNVSNGGGSGYDVDGGAVDVTSGSATINGGTFTDNTVSTAVEHEEYGGAIYSDGTLTVNVATFTDNGAYDGGAIYTESTVPTLMGDTFKDNSASEDGGAVYNADTMTVTGGTFTGNSAEYGGAFYNTGSATVSGATFSQNDASEDGGAIYNAGTAMTVSHSILSRNTADEDGGGIYNDAPTHTLTLDTDQITSNTAEGTDGGGGIDNDAGTVTVSGGLISGNNPENCEPLNSIAGCSD